MQVNYIHMYIKVYEYRLMEDKKFQSVSKTKQSALPIYINKFKLILVDDLNYRPWLRAKLDKWLNSDYNMNIAICVQSILLCTCKSTL